MTDSQAERRRRKVTPVDGEPGEYQINSGLERPLMFKAGEVFAYDGEIPKATGEDLTALDEARETAAQEPAKTRRRGRRPRQTATGIEP